MMSERIAETTGASTEPAPLSRTSVVAVFVSLMIAMIVGALDQTIVATALPTIVGDLDGADHMLWVTTGYVLASTVTMPFYGKMGDLIGRKRLFLGSLGIFAIGSIICALTPDMEGLIGGRAVQGLGGGGLMILSQTIVADIIPPRKRAWYMSIMGLGYAVPTIAGPLLGGLFTDTIGWQWCFWMNVPLALAAIIVAVICLPDDARAYRPGMMDTGGTVTLTLFLSAITLAITLTGSTLSADSPVIIALVIVAFAMAALFIRMEARAREPIMALYLFRNRNFIICTLSGFITMFILMGVVTYLPTYYQIVNGMSATVSGFMELPSDIAWFGASLISGALIARSGRYKKLMVTSFVILALGTGSLLFITPETPGIAIASLLCIAGFGIGLNFEILVLIVQNEFDAADVGMSTAATNLVREMGTTLGAAAVGALFTSRLTEKLSADLSALGGIDALGVSVNALTPAIVRELPDATARAVQLAYHDALIPAFALFTAMAVIGLVLIALLREKPLARE